MEIFQNTIVKLIVRQGANSDRKNIVLTSGELGYTTDSERLYVGNGYLSGGVVVGNLFKGKTADLTSFAPCEIGDMAYSIDKNKLVYVKNNDGSLLSDWDDLSVGTFTSGDEYIDISTNYEISLNPLSAGILTSDTVASNSPIYIDPNGRLELRYQSPIIKSGNQLTVDISGIINTIYPVGAIYLSYNNVNPGILFAGTTWVQEGQGRYIAGVGSNTDTYGVSKTIASGINAGVYNININVPPHRHGMGRFTELYNNDAWFIYGDWDDGSTNTAKLIIGEERGTNIAPINGSPMGMKTSLPVETSVPTISSVAPPSYGLYIWRRTA